MIKRSEVGTEQGSNSVRIKDRGEGLTGTGLKVHLISIEGSETS